jgi:DNA methylase
MTLFGANAIGLNDQRAARRSSLAVRVATCADVVNASPDEPWIVWCGLNDEGDALTAAIPGAVQLSGSDSPDRKEEIMAGFSSGAIRVLVSKPSICGFGMNWQHCARQAFVGVDNSYEAFYQAVRRSWRFGQAREVEAHVFYATTEGEVVRNLRRKESDAAKLSREMVNAMSEFSVSANAVARRDDYHPVVRDGNGWSIHLGDCVEAVRSMPSASIGYSIFSPPFASLYTYSNSERDMGNCRTDEEFATHFRFLVKELFRVLMDGRLVSFHCMNLPTSKERDGYIGVRDFRGMLIRMFEEEGFIFHSEVCIWKDPVTAMQRTKALGLLHKTIRKDSAMSRQGIPDYLVTMRKPGDNTEPITHTPDEFPVHVWQRYASPVWMDINPSKTLQYQTAREQEDERHICPLQLQVIERGIDLWTNPGDTVLSPFTGIGSEGYVAIKKGRKFVGAELKRSYWELACKNLGAAEIEAGQATLFDIDSLVRAA